MLYVSAHLYRRGEIYTSREINPVFNYILYRGNHITNIKLFKEEIKYGNTES